MRRILIDDRIKKLAAEYVKKLPLVVGDVKADLQILADDLKKKSTEILICTPEEGKKAKGKSSVRKKTLPDAIEAANAVQPLKDKQEKFKGVSHKGSEYLRVSVYVEKIVEKTIEVPVEKIVEKIIVDETRVKELEGLLDEERRHTADLQARLDESSRKASDAAKAAVMRENALRAEVAAAQDLVVKHESSLKDAANRETKYIEQVQALEDELRRLPQAASEVADIQAAVYSIITGEAEDLTRIIDAEKREFEELKQRYTARADKLLERRHELLKRSGYNIEDMTRKALLNRPEDPRAVQLRKEFDEFRRAHDHLVLDKDEKIRELSEQLRLSKADGKRAEASMKDVTQLRHELEQLHERLQTREKELLAERQQNEELRQQQAARQQALLARLASLESPSIGTAGSLSTNQSREAHQVKLPGWMSFRK